MTAFNFNIKTNTADSQQATNWACACFYSYTNPDTFHIKNKVAAANQKTAALDVFRTVVVSDILNVTVRSGKGGLNTTAQMLLSSGDFNYTDRLSPGDHVFIWMHNDYSFFSKITNQIETNQAANGFNSGLKFMGKIESVRQIITTAPTGVKTLRHLVVMKAYKEFESQIYFNPLLASANDQPLKFYAKLSDQWNSLLGSQKGATPVGNLIAFFIDVFFGNVLSSTNAKKFATAPGNITRSPNDSFLIPKPVARLLGIQKPSKVDVSYTDVLRKMIGIQKYDGTSFIPNLTNPIQGAMISLPDNFNNVTIWSLLDAHKNSTLNEMFVSLRVAADNNIYPTLVVRQQPFTSKFYTGSATSTKFLDVPRWAIDPARQINDANLGTTDAVRCNFLQVYGQMYNRISDPQRGQQEQIVAGNYAVDNLDIIRSGSRNFILSSNSDVQVGNGQATTNIKMWKDLLSDWYMNLHLKANGSLTVSGIFEPICVGDNLSFDGVVYQIEGITHSYEVSDREKTFITSLDLSQGVLENGNYIYTRKDKRNQIESTTAPGYSDTELTVNDHLIVSSQPNSSGKNKGN